MPDAKQPRSLRIPPALIGAGLLVVALGFGLPALVSQPPAPADAPPRTAPQPADAFAPRPTAPVPQSPANLGVALVRLVVALVVVCGLCVLVARWVGRKPPETATPAMTVLASLRVGRCAVHLVRAGDRRMLIGTDASGVKALVELPGTEPEPEALPDAVPVASRESTSEV